MSRIVCFGEALIDFLNVTSETEGKLTIPLYKQFPGGAPANVAVAISKLGGDAAFAGQVGNDAFGQFLSQSLETFQVDTRLMNTHPTAKTPMAFVMLDANGERSFEFYREQTADLLITEQDVKDSWYMDTDVFHFCSNTLTDESIRKTTRHAIEKAQKQGCIVSFDINLRHNLWSTGKADSQTVLDCFEHVDLIKVSKEELDYLSPDGERDFVVNAIEKGVSTILITDGGNPIKVIAKGIFSEISAPATAVVDTTAAGDAFTGGFLFALANQDKPKSALADQEKLEAMTLFASKCGAHTVSKQGAFTALPTLEEIEAMS